jgi:hypothetical protein
LLLENPLLAEDPEFWSCQGSVGACLDLLELLNETHPDPALVARMFNAVFRSSASPDLLVPIHHRFGAAAIAALLDWINANGLSDHVPFSVAQQVLSAHADLVLSWMQSSTTTPEAALVGAGTLDPKSPSVNAVPLDLCYRVDKAAAEMSSDLAMPARSFLFTYAVRHGGQEFAELAVRSFEPIHEVLASGQLDYSSWLKLRDVLPALGPQHDWDKCERLRRGVVAAFVRHGWRLDLFFRLAENSELFRSIIHSARSVPGGAELIDRIGAEVLLGKFTATPEKAQMLRANCTEDNGDLDIALL